MYPKRYKCRKNVNFPLHNDYCKQQSSAIFLNLTQHFKKNIKNRKGLHHSLMVYTLNMKNEEIVSFLSSFGSPNKYISKITQPLHIIQNSLPALQLLLEKGCTVMIRIKGRKNSAYIIPKYWIKRRKMYNINYRK